MEMSDADNFEHLGEVAIVGLAGRFPGARHTDEFWRNLRDGVESITFYSPEELAGAGVDAATLKNPRYVRAKGALRDMEMFDASFFGFTRREAEVADPQQRIFMECAWEALENAGCDPETYGRRIGVYAGSATSEYVLNIYSNPELVASAGDFQIEIGNDKDHLAPRVSYKLNLKGPSLNVQTGCSTSLVAVHLACQSLLDYECDMALAGGVSVNTFQMYGYLYQEGSIRSPDGHCRAFDAEAAGTVPGNGVGIVVLKRLAEALADGDYIHAVIKGSAINNDGAAKIGYPAPGIEGQSEVIAKALAIAGVEPDSITYVEAHGTGTPLGDPVELAALTKSFRARTNRSGFCAIGSVKTNIGHLNTAAGVTGLIKTVLALRHRQLPPSLHFTQPNPKIDFEHSPFYVNAKLSRWESAETPRRAGVSSFGIGGTNAHVILEEAPPVVAAAAVRPYQLLTLSARTETALEAMTANLLEHLKQHRELNLADVAYTLHTGRRAFAHRRTIVCRDVIEAAALLETRDPRRVADGVADEAKREIVFLFGGQDAPYFDATRELYRTMPTFRADVDLCCRLLMPHLNVDLRELLDVKEASPPVADERINQTCLRQPALFVLEYALAQLWLRWGIAPSAMLGHGTGEYVAACLAGVFSLEDALRLVAVRGRLMQQLPPGAMLAVNLAEDEAQELARGRRVSLAAVDAAEQCVLAGGERAISELARELNERGIAHHRLPASHAFHSEMLEPIIEPFVEEVKKVRLSAPQIPFISNTSGKWISTAQAIDPYYWGRQLIQTVRFADGLNVLLRQSARILLEVSPGETLSTLARQHPQHARAEHLVLPALAKQEATASEVASEVASMLDALGRLWLAGVRVDWKAYDADQKRRLVPLPTYPFERQRYWVDNRARPRPSDAPQAASDNKPGTIETTQSAPARADGGHAGNASRAELEQKLAEIWAALFGLEEVGVEDDFLALGGHSLLAIQLITRVREVFQVELPLDSLFASPTVAGMAERVEAQLSAAEAIEAEELERIYREIESLSPDEARARLEREGGLHNPRDEHERIS